MTKTRITMPLRLFAGTCVLLAALSACRKEDRTPAAPATPDESAAAIVLPSGAPPQPDIPRASHASTVTNTPIAAATPRALRHNGQDIDPLCFNQLWEQAGENPVVRLDDCNPGTYTIVEDPEQYAARDGFTGTAYRPADIAPEMMPALAFIEYKYLGAINGLYAVFIRESGGGTGLFTSLHLFERDGATLRAVKNIAGGDRCNGGLENAHVDNGVLHYDVNLTPLALYALGGGETDGVNSPELQDCAVCCYAVARYEGETALRNVSLAENLADMLSQATLLDAGAQTPATCFDRLAQAQLQSGETVFTPEKLSAFANKVENECLSAESEQTAPADSSDSALP